MLLVLGSGWACAAEPGLETQPFGRRETESDRYDRCLGAARSNPADALTAAEEWRRAGGGFPAEHCAALALIGLKRYPEAAQRLEALAGAMMQAPAPMRADALEQAGQAWLLADKGEAARSAFEGALQFKPDDPDLLIDRAEALAAVSRYWDAIDDLDHALDHAPDRADALTFRASAYRHVGRLDSALADIERALSLDEQAPPGLLERGNIRRLKGDDAGARADWRQVEALAPDTPAAAAAKENLARLDATAGAQNR